MKTLLINLPTPYPIYIGDDLLNTHLLKEFCIKLNKRPVIITESHLINSIGQTLKYSLQQQNLHVEILTFPAGERYKTRETKQKLEDELLLRQFGRDTCLIALGGGVVTDLVGFLAATYCRGVPVIYIPTTLLAMVDASLGGKTGVNTPHGKNLIGTFTQPHTVLIDTRTLNTLPHKEWCNGIVEVIKHGLIADETLFEFLQKNSEKIKQRKGNFLIDMIYASCLIKKNIVEHDEYEHDLRQLLNFGHTIGHAIETIEDYRISHGEAVAIGMLVESYLSIQYAAFQKPSLIALKKLLQQYDLPLKTSAFQDKEAFKKTLMLDKKAIQNKARFISLQAIGKPHRYSEGYLKAAEAVHLNAALDWALQHFNLKPV